MRTPIQYGRIVHPFILEPRELNEILAKGEDILLVDLSKEETWIRGHIAGAVHIAPATLVSGIKPAVGKLPDIDVLNTLMGSIGYTRDRYIVAYDDEGGGWAGRFLWTLSVLGHTAMSYLNGGLAAWLSEGHSVTAEIEQPVPAAANLEIDSSKLVSKDEIIQHLGDPDLVIWDARSHDEYTGQRVFAARGGHIPGAINLDWLDVMDRDNHLKIRSDIAEILTSLGISRDKKVITHCQTHHRSGLTWLVGTALEYDIRAYDGSWSEWGNDPSTPVETR
ncbi:MAG: rhodanese-like domain-containing protein [Pseudomonadales bacterium]